jgi:hypothetical protein
MDDYWWSDAYEDFLNVFETREVTSPLPFDQLPDINSNEYINKAMIQLIEDRFPSVKMPDVPREFICSPFLTVNTSLEMTPDKGETVQVYVILSARINPEEEEDIDLLLLFVDGDILWENISNLYETMPDLICELVGRIWPPGHCQMTFEECVVGERLAQLYVSHIH